MKKPAALLALITAIGAYVLMISTRGASDEATKAVPAAKVIDKPPLKAEPVKPIALVAQPTHDFGALDPGDEGHHLFLVRNLGNGPLELYKGSTTCKCTLADFPNPVIPPGGTGQVRVSWKAVTDKLLFEQQATVLTNDPEQRAIVLQIKGEVRTHLAAEPSQLVFSGLYPGESQVRRLTLFSQAWDDFEILSIKSTSAQLRWIVKPAPPETLSQLKAQSGYLLEVTSPNTESVGHFTETLHVSVAPKGQPDQERAYDVVVTGNRLKWLSVNGESVHGLLGMEIGAVAFGQGAKRRATLLLRDPKRKLKIERVEATPNFIQTSITPARSESENSWCNLYHLNVEIPADAPVCTYLAVEKGELRFYSDDPTLPVVKMPFAFAVIRDD
jgi:hypothetical protein